MKALANIVKIIISLVFISSGFVKIIDPLGTSYRFVDYFKAFGWEWMIPAALVLSFIMCLAEFFLGIMLLLNVKLKLTTIGITIFMGIFTPVTLYLAITNAVSDCGCFGDAIKFTNWETFYKDLIIDVLLLVFWLTMKHLKPIFTNKIEWVLVALCVVGTFSFELYNYGHLPIIDFRPYKVGNNIPDLMSTPDDAPKDSVQIQLVYEKDGVQKTFDTTNYPWQDSTWHWVETKTEIIKEGYRPPIHGFNLVTTDLNQIPEIGEGEDITEIILQGDKVVLLVAYNATKANKQALQKANALADYCKANGYMFFGLTATSAAEVEQIRNELGLTYGFLAADETMLKTVVRANPGYVVLSAGAITHKWHYNDVPEAENFEAEVFEK